MTDNEQKAHDYLVWFSGNYTILKNKYRTYCRLNHFKWDEDLFSDTYLKIYEAIRRNGLKDTSPQGMDNYTFKSFKFNLKREGQYARNQKRDLNVASDDVTTMYEQWFNATHTSSSEKVKSDLYKDFSVLYIMHMVEENFPAEDFYLFRLKTLCDMTYKQIQDKTKMKRVRQRIMEVKNWVRENVKKDDVKNVFHLLYNDIL